MIRPMCLLVLLILAAPAQAQVTGWNGSLNTDWTNSANWTLGVPSGGNVLFSVSAANTTLDLGGGTSAALNNVIFQFGTVPAFTLQNGTLLMTNGGDVRINSGAAAVTQTINMGIVFQGGGSLTNNEAPPRSPWAPFSRIFSARTRSPSTPWARSTSLA